MTGHTADMAYGSGSFISILISLASLVIVVVMILLSRHALKFVQGYFQKGKSTRELAVVESIMLDQKRRMSIVRCGTQRGVILTGGGNDIFLGWMNEAVANAPTAENNLRDEKQIDSSCHTY